MSINLDMIGKKIEIAPFGYDQDDVIFYALSVGAGIAEIDFQSFSCRFSKPCFPADLFQTRGWQTTANELLMQTEIPDGRVVLDNFAVQLADQPLP